MKFNTFATKYGAYIVAALLFTALGYIYCKPVLSGRVLQSGDDINAVSAVHDAAKADPAEGEYGFWNGSMFSGMPNYQIGGGAYKSDTLMAPLKRFFHRGPAHPAWILIFYFLSFFILLRSFEVDKWLSIVGAIAIGLSSYFIVIIGAGHGGKTIAISYISLVAAGMHLIFRGRYAAGTILTLLFSALGFSIHPQMAYYLFMMTGVLFLAELYLHARDKKWKELGIGFAIFTAALLVGLGTGSSNIFANTEYASQTMRGGHSDLTSDAGEQASPAKGLDLEYATQWSYGIDETMTLLIPGFKGGANSVRVSGNSTLYKALTSHGVTARNATEFCKNVPMYWGDQPFTSGNVYVGAIVCFLFLLGLMIVRGPYKWALLAATLFSVALAWGSNFMPLTRLFFNYFPLYNKFRAVSSILVVAEITMPLLGFMAVKQLFDGGTDRKKIREGIIVSAAVTGGLCLLSALLGRAVYDFSSPSDAYWAGGLPSWLYEAILAQRASLLVSDSLRSLLFIALAAGTLYLFAIDRLRKPAVIALLGVLVVADMWPVDKRYFNDDFFITRKSSADSFAMQPYEAALLQDPDPHFRVLNLNGNSFNEARTSYYLKSIGGYHAAKLRRYQDLIDVHLSKMHWPVIGMLNAKYIIERGENNEAVPRLNPYALGNAWWVGHIRLAADAEEEITALGEIDLATEAVTDASFAGFVPDAYPGIAEDAYVRLTKYQPRFIDYECSSSSPGTIVFSEIYYPYGWKASIDGVPAEHFRVNYTLRALNVPSGRHTIHFEFDPDSVRKGDTIAVVCIALMYLTIAVLAVLSALAAVKRAR